MNLLDSDIKAANQNLIDENQGFLTDKNGLNLRYYQLNAIKAVVNAVIAGQKNILLAMATGTGKTRTILGMIYLFLKTKRFRRILFLVDRTSLGQQAFDTFKEVKLEELMTLNEIYAIKGLEDKTIDRETKIQIATVQSMVKRLLYLDEDNYNMPNVSDFDLIIVDECHRGSAKEDSRWKQILEYFSSATQIGMTATPKETQYASNVSYFGDPVYTYSLKDGIEDGFLAPFKVINIKTDIGDGWRPTKGQCDYFGNEIEDRVYTNSDYDYNIVIEDRINQVAAEITKYLRATDPMSKTIVFCPTEDAAERMRQALVNCNPDTVRQNSDYVVRITGNDNYGKSKLHRMSDFKTSRSKVNLQNKILDGAFGCNPEKFF